MAEEVKNVTDVQIEDTVKRINELNQARKNLESLKTTLETRQGELSEAETVYGADSKEYGKQQEFIELTKKKIAEAEQKVAELSFKKSELKPVFDEVAKQYDVAFKAANEKEYHIELATPKKDEQGNVIPESGNGKKVYKQLLDYLLHNMPWNGQNVVNLAILVRNMEENKAWTNSKDFDNVIILRSASVLSLWNFIYNKMEGKGFYDARVYLETLSNCGQSLTEAVNMIRKDSALSRELSTKLTTIEDEFNISEDDLPHDEEQMTTQEEVAPEVEE